MSSLKFCAGSAGLTCWMRVPSPGWAGQVGQAGTARGPAQRLHCSCMMPVGLPATLSGYAAAMNPLLKQLEKNEKLNAGVWLAAGRRLWEPRQPGCSATHPVWLPCSHCMFVGLTSEEEAAGSSSEDGSDSDDEGSSGSSDDSSSSDSEDEDSSSSGSGSSDSEEDEEGEEGSELMEGDLQQLRWACATAWSAHMPAHMLAVLSSCLYCEGGRPHHASCVHQCSCAQCQRRTLSPSPPLLLQPGTALPCAVSSAAATAAGPDADRQREGRQQERQEEAPAGGEGR